ncbi:2OG-Fe(II) oxygenase [Erythrobacter litoralis]|uniref:2OG-Fe(II) oxygenase family protein n=1 Tax=Erythrobacter litoralis TaxID=39960 RepID=UPI002435C046|nr:2OG-Fe(II) oxygenase [Erythrobacter litoralis]MDG6079093.1 2OG-Fe(II) oxygenase [Erythrobacter litoralis]
MLNISRNDVQQAPFPHVVKKGILDLDLYKALRADFPSQDHFAGQTEISGSTGSRVGQGTGFDIYRGDKTYDRLIVTSPAWKQFDDWINSPAFVEKFLDVFGPDLDALGCSIRIESDAYDRGLVEGREVLTEKATLSDKAKNLSHRLFSRSNDSSGNLFTRLDIERSIGGYAKPPHCDRQNRLCSLIVYFTDMEAEGIEGGDLSLFRHKEKVDPRAHERHPRPSDVEAVATLRPEQNLGVFFPCSNNSYHGVSALRSQSAARDFLYINISTDRHSAWA